MRSATGRADLVHALAVGGGASLEALASLMGFGRRMAPPASTATPSPAPRQEERTATVDLPLCPIPFWRLEAIKFMDPIPAPTREPEPTLESPITLEGLGKREGPPPQTSPLASGARLWPALRNRLAFLQDSRRVDIRVLARRWSEGLPLRRIPFRPLAAWAPRVTVLVDRSPRLIPFWEDQRRMVRKLRRGLGRAAVREVWYREELVRPWCDGRGFYRHPPIVSGCPVLALSDLGFLGHAAHREHWWRTGRDLANTARRRVALVSCPSSRWAVGMPRLWDAVDWARPRLGEQRAAGQGETHRQERTERLLTLVAFTSRIEPGLLRALRQLLPAGDADVGTEADVWNSPDVLGGLVSVAGLSSAVRTRYQMRFAALPDERKRQVVEVMRVWRAGLPKEIWLDEVLALEAGGDLAEGVLQAEELEAAHRLWRRMAATVEGAGSPPQEVVRAVQDFVREAIAERLPEAVWQDQELRPVLWRAWERSWKGEGLPALPKGADPAVLGGGEEGPIRGMVFQIGHGLQWYPAREERSTGSPLGEVESANRLGTLQGVVERLPSPRPLGGEAFLPLPAGSWAVLRTDRVEATFVRFDPPPWATALGRDRIGLWAAFEVEGVEQRLRWIPPGRFWMGSPEGEPGRWEDEGPRHLESIPQGFWLAETPCTQALWEAVMEHNPSRFQSEDHPVEQVSWNDCQEFLSRLNGRIEGLDVRLPQENEWEYACRAGTETATYAGAMKIRGNYDAPVLEEIAWYGGNSEVDGQKGTRPVATKRPNPWGLYDMLGNVNEWCTDAWRFTYDAPYGGSNRVCRGGSWYSYARVVRAAYRTHYSPSNRWRDLGFRLARGQGALELAEPEQGAERPGDGEAERGTRRSRRPSRPEAAWR